MTAGEILRKVHACTFCDESSVCARGKDNSRLGGVLDGKRRPKREYGASLLKLHSDEI